MSIERKLMAHYIDGSMTQTPDYERLGKDLEELSVEMNPEVEEKANILGESSAKVKGYSPSVSVEPYYAEQGTSLFTKVQSIIDNRSTGDDLKTTALEVHLWEEAETGVYKAYREDAIIVVQSYGGDTAGYAIPFEIKYTGNRVEGTFNPKTKEFTEASGDTEVTEE